MALFLYGVVASDGGSALSLTIGGCLGLLLGAAVCLLTYLGLVRIPPSALFATTTVLITLLAAGMAAQAVAFLERANWLTSLDTVVWDSGWLLSEASIPGRALHTLIGYTDANAAVGLCCRYRDNRLADAADRAGARRPRGCGGLERDGRISLFANHPGSPSAASVLLDPTLLQGGQTWNSLLARQIRCTLESGRRQAAPAGPFRGNRTALP
jgi:hypothetical protein